MFGNRSSPRRSWGLTGPALLAWVLLAGPPSALAQTEDGGAALAVPEEPRAPIVDDLPETSPKESKDTPDAGGDPVDSGEGTTFDIPLDAGVVEVPPLPDPEPDGFESEPAGQPELPKRPPPRRSTEDLLRDLPSAVATPEIATEQELAVHVEARAAALRAGDLVKADLELALIEELRVALAARNVVVASAQLIQEAKVAMDLGQLDLAAARADAAARLSPDLEAAHWMRARLHWSRDAGSAPLVVDAMQHLVSARFTAFRNQISFLTQVMTVFGLAIAALVILFAALQFMKYVRYPAHDLAQKVPDFIGGGELIILLFVIVVLPFGLGLGLAPTLALALATVVAYQQTRERWASWALMGLLAVTPYVLEMLAPIVSFHGSVVDAMAEATSEAFAEQAQDRLQRGGQGQGDYAGAMVLAHRLRLRGDVAAAEGAYRRAVKARASDPVAQNNLGVTLLAQGKGDEAEKAFKAAISKGAGAEPYLNLALMMAERGVFDQSSRYMESARDKDGPLVAQHSLMTGSASKRAAVAPFDEGLLWQSLFDEGRAEADAIAAQLWRPMSGRLPPWGASLFVILVTLLGAWTVRFEYSISSGCPRCGLPASPRAQAGLCDQCNSVFLSAVAVEPSLKAGKERAVRRYQRRRRWTERLLALIAGAGHLLAGRPVRGFLLFFPFALIAIGILVGERTIVHPWFVYVDESAYMVKATIAAGLLGILSLVSVRSSFEK